MGKGPGEVSDSLRMPNLENEEARCVLIMRFRDGKIFTEDPGNFCKDALGCGANAGFHILELQSFPENRMEPGRRGNRVISRDIMEAMYLQRGDRRGIRR